MKIALIGYGRMGRMIESLCPDRGHEVALRLDADDNQGQRGIDPASFAGIDVAIDFSVPSEALPNLRAVAATGTPMVIGVTGWAEHLPEARHIAEQAGVGVVWSPNYSVGVNVFARLVAEAASALASAGGYEAWAHEIHHSKKLDAPSGTLLMLADRMRAAGWSAPIDTAASRAGSIPGTHTVGFDSPADTITLTHTARNRTGFAEGALLAAEWVVGRKGFFSFEEVLFGAKT